MRLADWRAAAVLGACVLSGCWARCPEERVQVLGRCLSQEEALTSKRSVWLVEDDLSAGPSAGGAQPAELAAAEAMGDAGKASGERPVIVPDAGTGAQGDGIEDGSAGQVASAACPAECQNCGVSSPCDGCRTSADCSEPGHARCEAESGECVPCEQAEDCKGMAVDGRALQACDATTGQCVECTGSDYRACGVELETLRPLVCDSVTRSCASLREAGSDVCDACVSDAQCRDGQRCVPEVFAGEMLGYVCLWVPGSEVAGAPSDCLAAGRPYVDRRKDMTSIDGVQTDVCALRTTTCKALAEHGAKVRACEGADDGGVCGQPGLSDAECRAPQDSSAYRCVTHCGSSDDCKRGFACNSTEYPGYCAVQVDSCFADTDCGRKQRCVQQRCQVIHL